MKKVVFFLVLSLVFSCEKKESANFQKKQEWKIYTDTKEIPDPIIDFFEAYFKSDFKMSNPNEKFNRTDVIIYPDKSNQQLQFLANKNNIWRLVFIQGGIGLSNQFYEFEVNNDTISKVTKAYSFENIKTNDALEFYIKKGKVNFEKIKIKYEY